MNAGDLLKRRYSVSSLIASGSTSDVFLATSTSSGLPVAIKSLKTDPAPAPPAIERFAWEGKILCGFRHPNLVQGYEYSTDEPSPYIVMEYIGGVDLATLLAARGHLREQEAIHAALQVACGLNRLTERGQVLAHRDIKPKNILIEASGRVKLIDLGVARGAKGPWDGGVRMMGTPSYMAPEQWRAPGEVDVRADIYSIGCVLYEMIAGHKAFQALDRRHLEARHLSTRRPALPRWNRAHRHIQPLIDRCLSVDPSQRFETLDELERALRSTAGRFAPAPCARIPGHLSRYVRSL